MINYALFSGRLSNLTVCDNGVELKLSFLSIPTSENLYLLQAELQ